MNIPGVICIMWQKAGKPMKSRSTRPKRSKTFPQLLSKKKVSKRLNRHVASKLRRRIYVEQAGKCFYCGCECIPTDNKKIRFEDQPDNLFTIDHIFPISAGGSNRYANLLGSCRKCNEEKGKTTDLATFLLKKKEERSTLDK
jgi:5-methylcytosine-specific restriction endonuclease McrA